MADKIKVDDITFDVEEYFEVLENLRSSGKINMFGAPRWLQDNFGLDRKQAQLVFTKWTETFNATS
tara:strand:+ start:2522 stop:2719 length:198 start_codon:yes stop_codon:yes gene_type:complete